MALIQVRGADAVESERQVRPLASPWPPWLRRWLAPLAVWLAARCGYAAQQPRAWATTYRVLDTTALWERIALQRGVVEQLTARRARYLVVGRDVYGALLHDDRTFYQLQMAVQLDADKLMGLHVLLCPWVEGMCVLPDLCSRREEEAP